MGFYRIPHLVGKCKKWWISDFNLLRESQHGRIHQIRTNQRERISEDPDEFEEMADHEDPINSLTERVNSLESQVRYLKRIVICNIFDSKHDMKEFFNDIW
jgi:hypothetical protein